MITGEVEAVDRKQKIRDRYKGVDISELEVIPAKIIEDLETSSVIRRVAAYIRVSTDNDEQTSSYELQKNYYTDYIQAQPGWVFVGIYADEGISGTSLEHRKGMQQLIEDCKAGKIDLVLTKSIARFARNIVDCLSVIELLKNLNPPVGVKFEADNIYTLDSNGRMILTILASVAEEESHSKSIIMNWSIDRRFSRGLFLTPALLGYDKDEEGNLVINPEEAQTVKVIYYLYLNGYSLTEIATLLMEYIHAEGPAFFSWLPKMFGKRVVVTIHGVDWQREKWQSGFGSKFIRQGEKNAVKYADEIIVLSKGVQDYFKETYGRETHFIPNGVNRPQIREANLITDKFGLKKDSYILFLGRLVPEKGIRYLVEAFKNVKTDKKLVIAGGSSDTDSFMAELKELAKDDNRILFTGFVQGAMLDELYSNACSVSTHRGNPYHSCKH